MSENQVPQHLIGQTVVLDLVSPYVVVGRLAGADHRYLQLEDADVHDLRDSKTTREHYVVQCRQFGVRINRDKVHIRADDVVALSLLESVVV